MKLSTQKIFITVIFAGVSYLSASAVNPIVQTSYTADPAPMVHDGRVYVFTSHDEDVTIRNFFTMNDWKCFSSADMVNWTDHGTVLSYQDFDWSRGDAWAGQCIYRNGKFYYYVPLNQKNGGNAIGVAVSDRPEGPYKDALGEPLLTGYGYIDPTVFIDNDGQAYLYWGNPNLWYVKLNDDMLSYDKELGIVQVPLTAQGFHTRTKDTDTRPSSYEEGPWIYKRNKIYYLFYPAGGVPEHLAYSTGKSITGPWVYGDTIMHVIQTGGAFTNHPGVIDFKKETYLFYHSGALRGGGGFKRSVCIEQVKFNKDGSIPLITPTREGITKSVSSLDPYKRVEAETIAWSEGVKTTGSATTGISVTNIDNADYIMIKSVDLKRGATQFEAITASEKDGSTIEIRLDNKDGRLLGTCPVKNTGSLSSWASSSCQIEKVKGVHDIFLVFRGEGESLFNFDWWILKK